MASGLWWTAKQRCKKNRQAQSAVESTLTSHSLWSVVENAAGSFVRNRGGNRVAEEIRLCKELILFWAEELRLQRENTKVRRNIISVKRTVHTLHRRRHKMKMEIDKLTDQVEDYLERAQEVNHLVSSSARETPTDHFSCLCEENDMALYSTEAEKVPPDPATGISISQVWSQILLEGDPHNQQVVLQERVVNKPANNVEVPYEQIEGLVKDDNLELEAMKERVSPIKSPVHCPTPRLKDGTSLSETAVPQEITSSELPVIAQQAKSAMLDRDKPTAEENHAPVMKPDMTVQDTEISGVTGNHFDMTTEIMAIIENEVLYHIFPVHVIVDPLIDLHRVSPIGSNKVVAPNENVQETKQISEGAASASPEGSGKEDAVSQKTYLLPTTENVAMISKHYMDEKKEKDINCENTVETYMHYMYGGEMTPKSPHRVASTASFDYLRQPDEFAFVVSGEELVPRFSVSPGIIPPPPQSPEEVEKKISEYSFVSSETTDLSSDLDLDVEEKEVLILDLAVENLSFSDDSGLTTPENTSRSSEPTGTADNREETRSNTSATTLNDEQTSNTGLSKSRSLRKLNRKQKPIRSGPQKVKKFFCFT